MCIPSARDAHLNPCPGCILSPGWLLTHLNLNISASWQPFLVSLAPLLYNMQPVWDSCLSSVSHLDSKLQGREAPLGLALGSPIFPSGCEGKLGVALESLQGLRDLT